MRIGASFKVSAGEEAVIAALIVPTVADGAVEKHIIAATGALVKADINAACLPHPDQGNPHALRHTLATRLVEERTPLNIVQGILGHSSIETTRKYLHKSEDIEREAITSMTDYLNGEQFNNAPRLNGAKKRAKFAGIPLPDFSQRERITANNA